MGVEGANASVVAGRPCDRSKLYMAKQRFYRVDENMWRQVIESKRGGGRQVVSLYQEICFHLHYHLECLCLPSPVYIGDRDKQKPLAIRAKRKTHPITRNICAS